MGLGPMYGRDRAVTFERDRAGKRDRGATFAKNGHELRERRPFDRPPNP